jgi:hypothetical protein
LSFVDQVNLYLKSAKEPGFVKWDAKNAVWAVWVGVNVSVFFPFLAWFSGALSAVRYDWESSES